MARIKEDELILPSLYLMKVNGNKITTAELVQKLRLIMRPSGKDIEILAGRRDDKFSQKVRNLKAHNTFERHGFAQYIRKPKRKDSHFQISKEGLQYLNENQGILTYLLTNDFEYEDLKNSLSSIAKKDKKRNIQTFDENIIIQEGVKKVAKVKIYERSKKLRDFAINFYSKNDGKIYCECCSFNFEDFYGNKIGKGFIEIHHTKPIFQYEDEDIENTPAEAVKNLAPVCSNCHRMIHRNWSKPLEIKYLINQININGTFNRLS